MSAALDVPPSPVPPTGPSIERWRAMSMAERERYLLEVMAALPTPAETMTEGRPHARAKSAALDALTLHFRTTGRVIYVVDELAVIYPGATPFSPDLLAVLDVPQPAPDEDERLAWVVADEGKGPDLILEVLHHGSREKDLVRNVAEYARLGIREYFVYDRMRFRLHGYRLPRPAAPYDGLPARFGRVTSEVLGLDLALVDRRLRFFSGAAELPNSDELIDRLSRMMDGIEERAQQAEAQVQQAEAQVQQAEAQARAAVLDLAEAYGVEVTVERRHRVETATLEALATLRAAMKTQRAWPSG